MSHSHALPSMSEKNASRGSSEPEYSSPSARKCANPARWMASVGWAVRSAKPRTTIQGLMGFQALISMRGFACISAQTSFSDEVQNHMRPSWCATKLKGRTWGWSPSQVARYHAGTLCR